MDQRTLNCPHCGLTFATQWIKQVYCSKKCSTDFHNQRAAEAKKKTYQPRCCPVCDKVYIPIRSDSLACSPECFYRTRHPLKMISCASCGEQFGKTTPQAKYCSEKCRAASKPPPRAPAKAPVPRHQPRHCQSCGQLIKRTGTTNCKYCAECSKIKALESAVRYRHKRTPLTSDCNNCGMVFPEPTRFPYCDHKCKARHAFAKQEYHRTCQACEEPFVSHDRRRQTCNTSCAQWARNFPGVKRKRFGECEYCAQPFVAYKGDQKFCGSSCATHQSSQRRRALKRDAFVEVVSRARLAARDKWTCQLCGKKVRKTAKFPDPMSASMDHVIPISLGGEHSYANTQLAHLACNVRKGNRMSQPQQLALIG